MLPIGNRPRILSRVILVLGFTHSTEPRATLAQSLPRFGRDRIEATIFRLNGRFSVILKQFNVLISVTRIMSQSSADPNRVRDVFLSAVELPPEQRPGYLAEACGGDADLRAEVDRLLAANADPDSILEPVSPARRSHRCIRP